MNAKQVANIRQLSLEQRTVILVSGTGTSETMNQLLALLPGRQGANLLFQLGQPLRICDSGLACLHRWQTFGSWD